MNDRSMKSRLPAYDWTTSPGATTRRGRPRALVEIDRDPGTLGGYSALDTWTEFEGDPVYERDPDVLVAEDEQRKQARRKRTAKRKP